MKRDSKKNTTNSRSLECNFF
uniref:Uncharacterized protein n=1 Tax=Arundo donax TaxID=35708 RepID=A0A0A9BLT7_ARUDO